MRKEENGDGQRHLLVGCIVCHQENNSTVWSPSCQSGMPLKAIGNLPICFPGSRDYLYTPQERNAVLAQLFGLPRMRSKGTGRYNSAAWWSALRG